MDTFLPVHRKVGALFATGFAVFLGWVHFGELEIIASAQGKLVLVSYVKVINVSTAETMLPCAVVASILVAAPESST